ncbi:ROK family protein [Thermoactinospora rubra]|uniref:ROK family protein n=1 Tax=Thermoactinospora rubra TaxID=1088767 RepID=UPI0019824127|nr:ROK family protein [Thermoactinospora rubra]
MNLGIDIGGTKIAAGLVADDGTVVRKAATPTPAAEGAAAVVGTVVRLARGLLADGAGRPRAVGVGSCGMVDPAGRTITAAVDSIRGWAGTPLAGLLEDALGLPAIVRNDVQAFLAGELSVRPGLSRRPVVGVTAGTGIGGALAADGRIMLGAHGVAGHLGHVPVPEADGLACTCGASGHVEAVASGPAMATAYARAVSGTATAHPAPAGLLGEGRDLRPVAVLAGAGDPVAAAVLARGGTALGRALAGVVNVWDPAAVVVGGGVAAVGEPYLGPLRTALRASVLPVLADVPVVEAVLGADAVVVGAAREAAALLAGTGR